MRDRGTQERIPPTTARSLALLVAGALASFLLIDAGAAAFLRDRSSNRGYRIIELKWKLLEDLERPVDALVLGDSSCNQGLDPTHFSRLTGLKTLNLCTIGHMTALGDLLMLRTYLRRHGPPKLVLVIHAYSTYRRDIKTAMLARVPDLRLLWKQKVVSIDLAAWRVILAARLLPLYSQHQTLREMIMRPWEIRPSRLNTNQLGFMSSRRSKPRLVNKDTAMHLRILRRSPRPLTPSNRAAVRQMAALAESRGFDLYLLNSPVHDKLQRHKRFRKHQKQLRQELLKVIRPYRRVRYPAKTFPFPVRRMRNADHLTRKGAKAYTNAVVRVVRQSRKK